MFSEQEMASPILRRKSVKANNSAVIKTTISGDFGEMAVDEAAPAGTGTGPSPLQAVMGALCGCLAITFRRVATDRNFEYAHLDMEAEFSIDIRGRLGMQGVLPYFHQVTVIVLVTTRESAQTLAAVAQETLLRSPVYNLLKDTAAKLDVQWRCLTVQVA